MLSVTRKRLSWQKKKEQRKWKVRGRGQKPVAEAKSFKAKTEARGYEALAMAKISFNIIC